MKMIQVVLAAMILIAGSVLAEDKMPIIIDADTANEVDDLYAIVRALIEPEFEILGLSSAHWQMSHWATENTLEDSQRLNVMLLSYLNMSHIRHPRGAASRLYDWGQDVARHSAAAYHIVNTAKTMQPGQKLTVCVLGANTNIASAILIDPTIIPHIRVYLLGTQYNFETGVWKKTGFNDMNDIHALDVVLNSKGLETHIIPSNIAVQMKFSMNRLKDEFKKDNELLNFLYRRWRDHVDGGRRERVIWDLSVIEALIHPEMINEIEANTPPDNTQRKVFVAKEIQAEKMVDDFYSTFESYFKNK